MADKALFLYDQPVQECEKYPYRRCNKSGVEWPTHEDYATHLGEDGLSIIEKMPMRPIIIYAEERNQNWQKYGWMKTRDLAEGDVCVDDNARAAVVFAYDYIMKLSPSYQNSFNKALEVLSWVSYMITRHGEVYNFARLSSEQFAEHTNAAQRHKNSFIHRSEYYVRSISGNYLTHNGNLIPATPNLYHPEYTIIMRDLPVYYQQPRYHTAADYVLANSAIMYSSNLPDSSSTKSYGLKDARALWALAVGLEMFLEFEKRQGPNTEITIWKKYLQWQIANLINNLNKNLPNISSGDSKLFSMLVVALADLLKLQSYSDFIILQEQKYHIISIVRTLTNWILAQQVTSDSWAKGAFIHDKDKGHWQAWGELQIYALAKATSLKIFSSDEKTNLIVAAMLAADEFYSKHVFSLADNNNDSQFPLHILTQLHSHQKQYAGQIAYMLSPFILGLTELIEVISRYMPEGAAKVQNMKRYLFKIKQVSSWFTGNNHTGEAMYLCDISHASAFARQGATFDGLTQKQINRNSGAESTIEGLLALIFTKKAYTTYAHLYSEKS